MFAEDSALLIVDLQRDFCAGGALAVPDADAIVEGINRLADAAVREGRPVYASRDWHPADSPHFARNGGRWPDHCIQDTEGARFHPGLRLPASALIVSKGDSSRDPHGYDAFEGRLSDGSPLADDLRRRGVRRVVVVGLATDYCVKNSVWGARRAGFEVTVVTDLVRAVDLTPGDGVRALADMLAAGARLVTSDRLGREPR